VYDRTFGLPLDWGLGFMVNNGTEAPYNFGPAASGSAFGHGGQQSSLVFCDPENDLVFAAAYSGLCGEARHGQRMRQLLNAAFEAAFNVEDASRPD
jgi:CubicO group peptidase (beta-lactamase class C family)